MGLASSLSLGPLPVTLGRGKRPETGVWVGLHMSSGHRTPSPFQLGALMEKERSFNFLLQHGSVVSMGWESLQGFFCVFFNAQGTI